MKAISLLCAVALTATFGCASNPTEPVAASAPTAQLDSTASMEEVVTATGAPVLVADATAADENEIICESVASTGTRLAKRVCKTRAQREAEKAAAKDAVDKIHQHGDIQKKSGG